MILADVYCTKYNVVKIKIDKKPKLVGVEVERGGGRRGRREGI